MKVLMFKVNNEWIPALTSSVECPTPIFVCKSDNCHLSDDEWIINYKELNFTNHEFRLIPVYPASVANNKTPIQPHPMDRPTHITNDFGDPIYIPNDMGN